LIDIFSYGYEAYEFHINSSFSKRAG